MWADLSNLRRELIDRIEAAIARIFIVTQVGKSSALGNNDALESADDNDPGETRRGQRPVTRVQPWGLNGRPTSKVRGVGLRLGASNVVFVGILPTEGYGPQDLNDGETALYCATNGTEIRLDQNGNVKITAAAGADVTVNGGTADVARVGDNLTASGSLGTWAGKVELALSTLGSPLLPTDQFAPNVAPSGQLGSINSGAPHFKG